MHSLFVERGETNLHQEQPFYVVTKTWKYGGGVFGTDFVRGAQIDQTPKYDFRHFHGLITVAFSYLSSMITRNCWSLNDPIIEGISVSKLRFKRLTNFKNCRFGG